MYGCTEENLAHYNCHQIKEPIVIDGNLEKPIWKQTEKASLVELVTGEPASLQTKIAALWDKDYFYVGFWVEEPNVQAKLTKRDSLIYTENDIELFIAGKDCYYEFQINALGTIYEVFYIWQDAYKRGSRFDIPEFNLYDHSVDVLGGFQDELRYNKHPRGRRWAFMDWDFPGLKTAVQVQGTINSENDIDKGWTVELAYPWNGMQSLFGGEFKPIGGSTFRVNFSRFEYLTPRANMKQPIGFSLNSHGVYDSHIPNCFSYVHLIDYNNDQSKY